ncbi:hypothetical protein AVEN_202138-1 [Araneus ventricosus]|uniref:Uncharacterized protein n=1 Tax=Araneus ventricosus TaxID=182803 RepID=A0A4Y2E4A7_ARAVE|nr:hypothetical protein AVEN_202138-1 [Araneus ventricosus]
MESIFNHTRMEIIEIQYCSDLKAKFSEYGMSDSNRYLPARLENTGKLAYEINSMFGSTYRRWECAPLNLPEEMILFNVIDQAKRGLRFNLTVPHFVCL